MNREDIIRMARQSGMAGFDGVVHAMFQLEAFAALVASAEREKFCAVLRQLHDSYSLASDSNNIRTRGNDDDDIQDYVRPWVGLTEEDLKLLSAEWRIVYGAWMDDFARDIEVKLKEKNT